MSVQVRMARPRQVTVDPARDAAALLRRLGFLILFVGLPFGALASRNGAVVVVTIGIVLVALAATFDGAARPIRASVGRLAGSATLVAVAVVTGWSLLSILWSPAQRAGSLGGVALIAALGLVGYLALPDRMRAANLYLIPVAAGIAAVASLLLAIGLRGDSDPETSRRVERGLVVLALYAWPAISWLRSRGRDVEAVAIALVVSAAAVTGPTLAPALAFAFGAVIFLIAQVVERGVAGAVGLALGALIVLTPALVAFGLPYLPDLGRLGGWSQTLEPWRSVIVQDPLRLLTGRGIGALRNAAPALSDARLPGAPILALWYELGMVGALGAAAAIWTGLRSAGTTFGPLLPGVVAAFATAFAIAVSGVDAGESWWAAALAVAALAFVAAERGQFRTRRPSATPFGRARSA